MSHDHLCTISNVMSKSVTQVNPSQKIAGTDCSRRGNIVGVGVQKLQCVTKESKAK